MDTNKRKEYINWFFLVIIYILICLGWIDYDVYEASAPYGTLIAFAGLAVLFVNYENPITCIKNKNIDFLLMILADVVAFVNIFLVNSGKGAILIVVDIMLILYLCNKVSMTKIQLLIFGGVSFFFFLFWTVDIKGYYKGYNTNFGGLVLISTLICAMLLLEYVRTRFNIKYMWILKLVLMLVGYKIISFYLSRAALAGYLTFVFLILMPKKIWENGFLYKCLCIFSTAGSIVFSVIYVWLGNMRNQLGEIKIFYKGILSGREEVWSELWDEFIKKPLTGIGSSYELKVEGLEGTLEVHNGMLDILIIHGIIVFIIMLYILLKRLFQIQSMAVSSSVCKYAAAGIFAMLFTGFFENYFIIPPFSLFLIMLFVVINTVRQGQEMESEANLNKQA